MAGRTTWRTSKRGERHTGRAAASIVSRRMRCHSSVTSRTIVVQKLGQLNAGVTAARTERLAHEAMYEQLRAIEASGAPLDTLAASPLEQLHSGIKGRARRVAARARATCRTTRGPPSRHDQDGHGHCDGGRSAEGRDRQSCGRYSQRLQGGSSPGACSCSQHSRRRSVKCST